MNEYDILVVGGGVAGSISAKLSAERGLKTLLIEKAKTPRNKPCSGIQFSYFEKLIGEKILATLLGSISIYGVLLPEYNNNPYPI